MTPLMEYVDIAIGNEQDAADIFSIQAKGSDPEAGRLDAKGYEDVTQQLVDRFGLQSAAITLRESVSASDNIWSACLLDGKKFYQSKKYPIHVVDRVGGGDAFSAGLIFGLLTGKKPDAALEFAVAASCLKQTIRGDFNLVTVQEVDNLVAGDASGRIKR
jgi:2-dehydro-3-deoxygluconokinase